MTLALQTLSDKPYFGSVTSGDNARDSIRMSEILFGGREAIEREPVMFAIVNVNSPLRYDERMLEALHAYAEAAQPVIVTPFLLMGTMAPVSIPAAIAQQTAEAFAGIALMQLLRPGTPVLLGSFLSTTNMQSGSPNFGGPESALGLYCTGQIARRYELPWRAGGGALTSSQTVDAQAAYEGLNTMLPAFLAGANLVMHTAGWLESGLVSCYEKMVVDVEIVRTLQAEFTPLTVDEESLAFDAHLEVGQGGHFLGAAHTLTRFRDCFYRPLLSSSDNFERWLRNGGLDAQARATEIWTRMLDEYEPPALDEAVAAELEEYVARRRRELGD
jgi:trimethylamine--corrinoid protein Co-methyltransferase